jgi:murein DD-endopeptidase MepM/ murein hydrolase activator NlpD
MHNPLDNMKLRSNNSHDAYLREVSETHNAFHHNLRIHYVKDKTTHKNKIVRSGHDGWDLLADEGTPVYSIAEGKVVLTNYDSKATVGYGTRVEIEFDHKGQKCTALYGHLNDIYVAKGVRVDEGQIIGVTGHTGNASNLPRDQWHLHFEIRTKDGDGHHGAIDPVRVLGGKILICRPQTPSALTPPPPFCPTMKTGQPNRS